MTCNDLSCVLLIVLDQGLIGQWYLVPGTWYLVRVGDGEHLQTLPELEIIIYFAIIVGSCDLPSSIRFIRFAQ